MARRKRTTEQPAELQDTMTQAIELQNVTPQDTEVSEHKEEVEVLGGDELIKRRIIIATGVDEGYWERAQPYIETLNNNVSGVDKFVLCSGFAPPAKAVERYSTVKFVTYDPSVVRAPNSISCIQHGAFVDIIPDLNHDDVIVFTDADGVFQRNLTYEERVWLLELEDGEASAVPDVMKERYNVTIKEYLEMPFMRWLFDPDISLFREYEFDRRFIANAGMTAARTSTWRRAYEEYVKEWPSIDKKLHHYAKQQLLLAYVLQGPGFKWTWMPWTLHSHGHNGLHSKNRVENGVLYYENEVVFFRHAV